MSGVTARLENCILHGKMMTAVQRIDLVAKNEWKITPLHYAAQKGHLAVCQLIINNVNDKNPNEAGITPLHYAAENGHFDICQLIIDNVDDKNPNDITGSTPLDLAKFKQKEHVYCLFRE